jgi:hypothetical protein
MKKRQSPNSKHQIPNNNQMPITEILRKIKNFSLGYLNIGHWNLFGVWDLVIGMLWM